MTRADIEGADELIRSAFGWAQSRRNDLARFYEVQPDGWLLAEGQDRLVGMVGAVIFGSCATIGMMAVDPREQGRGIGRFLMEALLDRLDRAGCPVALLDASPAGAPLYLKLGFVDEGRTREYVLPAGRSGGQAPEEASLVRRADLPALEAFDAPVFGAQRGKLLAAYHADFPGRAFLVRTPDGEIDGYLFAQEKKLGPWVARTPRTAEILLRAGLSLPFENGTAVLAPDCNPDALALLERNGFSLWDAIRHMRRGGSRLPGVRAQIYGQASYAVG